MNEYEKNKTCFLFGSKSRFDDLCYGILTKLKEKYPHIKRIYVRAEYPYINDEYRSYLSERYEDTYYPEHIINAGKAAYIERNFEMINRSGFCIFCYDENYIPSRSRNSHQPKSGTKIAYDYAVRHCGHVINVFCRE